MRFSLPQWQRKTLFFKGVASFLAFSFILSDISQTPSFAQTAPRVSVPVLDPNKITLPEELGTIQESFFSKDKSGKLVIYLQGAHTNYDSESNTRKIIEFFQKEYRLPLVLLEGGEGKLDPLFFRSFPDRNLKEKILNQYLKEGDLSAGEIASIWNEFDTDYYGIEEKSLYRENKAAFLKSIEKEDEIIFLLDKIESELTEKLAQIDGKAKEFLEKQRAFLAEKVDLLEYLRFLSPSPRYVELTKLLQVQADEKQISNQEVETVINRFIPVFQKKILPRLPKPDQMEMNQLIQWYRIGRLNHGMLTKRIEELATKHNFFFDTPKVLKSGVRYAKTLSSIKGTRVFEELEALEEELRNSFPKTDEEKSLLNQFYELELIRDFAKLELTPKKWWEIKKVISVISAKAGSQRPPYPTVRGDDQIIPGDNRLYSLLADHFRFYELAGKRDEVLFQNAMKLMNRENTSLALLSTGGFHTQGITERLKANGVSYLLISPNIRQFDDRSHYLKAMKDERSFMKHFRGSYWDALARDYSEKIAGAYRDTPLREVNAPDLKLWRDRIIQNLVSEERIAQAKNYTQYVDALVSPDSKMDQALSGYFARMEDLLRKKLNVFGEGLKEIWSGNITPEAVSSILDRMNQTKIANLHPELSIINDSASIGQLRVTADESLSVEFTSSGVRSELRNKKSLPHLRLSNSSRKAIRNKAEDYRRRRSMKRQPNSGKRRSEVRLPRFEADGAYEKKRSLVEDFLGDPYRAQLLKPRQRLILSKRFLYDEGEAPETLEKIAESFQVTKRAVEFDIENALQTIWNDADQRWRNIEASFGITEDQIRQAYERAQAKTLYHEPDNRHPYFPEFAREFSNNAAHYPLVQLLVAHYNLRHPEAPLIFDRFVIPNHEGIRTNQVDDLPSMPVDFEDIVDFVEQEGGLTSWNRIAEYFGMTVSMIKEIVDAREGDLWQMKHERRRKLLGVIPWIVDQKEYEQWNVIIQTMEGINRVQRDYRLGMATREEILESLRIAFPDRTFEPGMFDDTRFQEILWDLNRNRMLLNRRGTPRHVLLQVVSPIALTLRDLASMISEFDDPLTRTIFLEALEMKFETLKNKFNDEEIDFYALNYNIAVAKNTVLWPLNGKKELEDSNFSSITDETLKSIYQDIFIERKDKVGADPLPSLHQLADQIPLVDTPLLAEIWQRVQAYHLSHPSERLEFCDLNEIGSQLTVQNILAFTDALGGLASYQMVADFFNSRNPVTISGKQIKEVIDKAGGLDALKQDRRRQKNELIPLLVDQPQFEKLVRIIHASERRLGLSSTTEIYKSLGNTQRASMRLLFAGADPETFLSDLNHNHRLLNRKGKSKRMIMVFVNDRSLIYQRQILVLLSLPEFEGIVSVDQLRRKILDLKLEPEISKDAVQDRANHLSWEQFNDLNQNLNSLGQLPIRRILRADRVSSQLPVLNALERIGGIALTERDLEEPTGLARGTIQHHMRWIETTLKTRNKYRAYKGLFPLHSTFASKRRSAQTDAQAYRRVAQKFKKSGKAFSNVLKGFHFKYRKQTRAVDLIIQAIYDAVIGEAEIIKMNTYDQQVLAHMFSSVKQMIFDQIPNGSSYLDKHFRVSVLRALNVTGPIQNENDLERFGFYLKRAQAEAPLAVGRYLLQRSEARAIRLEDYPFMEVSLFQGESDQLRKWLLAHHGNLALIARDLGKEYQKAQREHFESYWKGLKGEVAEMHGQRFLHLDDFLKQHSIDYRFIFHRIQALGSKDSSLPELYRKTLSEWMNYFPKKGDQEILGRLQQYQGNDYWVRAFRERVTAQDGKLTLNDDLDLINHLYRFSISHENKRKGLGKKRDAFSGRQPDNFAAFLTAIGYLIDLPIAHRWVDRLGAREHKKSYEPKIVQDPQPGISQFFSPEASVPLSIHRVEEEAPKPKRNRSEARQKIWTRPIQEKKIGERFYQFNFGKFRDYLAGKSVTSAFIEPFEPWFNGFLYTSHSESGLAAVLFLSLYDIFVYYFSKKPSEPYQVRQKTSSGVEIPTADDFLSPSKESKKRIEKFNQDVKKPFVFSPDPTISKEVRAEVRLKPVASITARKLEAGYYNIFINKFQKNNSLMESLNQISSRIPLPGLVNGALNREIARQIAEALRQIKLNGVTADQIPALVEWMVLQKIDEFYALEKARFTQLKGIIRIDLNDLSSLDEFFRTAYALVVLSPDLVIEINSQKGTEQELVRVSGRVRNEFQGKIPSGRIRPNPPVYSSPDVVVSSNVKAEITFDAASFTNGRPVPSGVAAAALLTAASLLKKKLVDGVQQGIDGIFRWQNEYSVQMFGAQGIVAITQAQQTAREVFQRAA